MSLEVSVQPITVTYTVPAIQKEERSKQFVFDVVILPPEAVTMLGYSTEEAVEKYQHETDLLPSENGGISEGLNPSATAAAGVFSTFEVYKNDACKVVFVWGINAAYTCMHILSFSFTHSLGEKCMRVLNLAGLRVTSHVIRASVA